MLAKIVHFHYSRSKAILKRCNDKDQMVKCMKGGIHVLKMA